MTKHLTPITHITDSFAVAGQLGPMDFAFLKARGFRTVINNRPDGEDAGNQLRGHEAEALARAHGLDYVSMPVTGLDVTEDAAADAFRAAIETREGPVLAYCASGFRSLILWSMGETRERSVADIMALGDAAGFDLELVEEDLEDRAARTMPRPSDILAAGHCAAA